MDLFVTIAEQRIHEAQQRGEFNDLPGAGEPLDLTDDALVPEELRVAYRILKNSGFVPPEIEGLCEIRELRQLLRQVDDADERARIISRIDFLLSRAGGRRAGLRFEPAYAEILTERLEARRRRPGGGRS